MDCLPFLNWNEDDKTKDHEKAVVFRSLVATVKFQPALDVSLEAKAAKFLKSVTPEDEESTDAFFDNLASISDDSHTNFVQSIVVLVSSPSQVLTTASMDMLSSLLVTCSAQVFLALVKADLFPQLIIALNPLSLSFTIDEDIISSLISTIANSFWIPTQGCLEDLEIKDHLEQQVVHETVLKQVLVPLEQYICHLCVHRYSISDDSLSCEFLSLLARLLHICPSYQPTMDFVLHMPVFLTIPSCLTFFENEYSIWGFPEIVIDSQREWNDTRGDGQQMWQTMHRMLRMEGIEDVMEEQLRNDKNRPTGRLIVVESMELNNLQGMNIPEQT
ncbi:hypothetical protein BLNAU_3097 [Blattamonas nauphoetae]|uniref:Uncharacterized protein n=1 Tax=Blattamonas nauphoetae TaxID=2049346 RepID=A0ABQ9YE33_9EUKA|nr:hypothetical protein BLNAU_3097 [Blattamonas nauphoetae]